jgi:hypothetical protein
VVNLVTQDQEGNLGELLHGQKRVELRLSLKETLIILSVNEENNSGNLREVVLPETTGLLMSTEIEGGELNVSDGKLLGS